MKLTLEDLLTKALRHLQQKGLIPINLELNLKIERSKEEGFGDFATNIALSLAKISNQSPPKLAERIIAAIPNNTIIEKAEIAGPGFINFFLNKTTLLDVIAKAIKEGDDFGHSTEKKGQKVILEFVSANPTGPLHVGHGRSAAFGASLANILAAIGYEVSREYYVNDAGRQMNILAVSVWLRYLNFRDDSLIFPTNAYRGSYVIDMARTLKETYEAQFFYSWEVVKEGLPLDEPQGGDKEIYIDALINRAQQLLGKEAFKTIHQLALTTVLNDIKADLAEFGVEFDGWFSEQSLANDDSITKGLEALKQGGHCYEKEKALWFRATAFGDEKDRVLVRANGQTTYFASDVAYHWNKYHRGFSRVIDIFGADHHGYLTRVKSAVKALGHDEKALDVLLVQFAILYRAGERVQMSTRSGSFVTLRELREEVGNDAARFFYVMRKPEQHMDFDLDLAKSESNDNPVYYIQYAHARISSVLRQLQERGLSWNEELGLLHLNLLIELPEKHLITLVSRYPEVIQTAANCCEPHQLAYYLKELAQALHSYYNAVTLLCEDEKLRAARLSLLKAVKQALKNGLKLLGVSALEKM